MSSKMFSKSSAGAITGPATLGSVTLTAGSGDAACVVTDASAGASSAIVAQLKALAGTVATVQLQKLRCNSGVYLESVSGTGALVLVELV